ncbi:MAG: spore coat protein [Candidatus Kerfeldbacteria bacterium CG_4_10_14_0_8_um_filter_42_10]|uniref:Spore coat protein n=1 Tax=Candidatus Kerfeldbacteria bacterium CG_4_10_14_0_8_um_filter_42_10 TaxID=2014248 RepID=A0A2M7RKW3_9BACT|nr:MAG: spore coat protein [Candidatus Kerfeldbacteria bacterium CG_4_10_14_0_8_um_filter_42_10]
MIKGVKIKKLAVHQDIPDRKDSKEKPGFLMEVLRDDEGLLKKFGQTTFTVAYQDAIKAFHYHKKQDDLWFVATGQAMVVLYDLRENSSTKGEAQVVYAGQDDYKLIVIPAGVAHGYKVISKEPVLLFYHTTESYNVNDPDEERLSFDDPKIGFDWNRN